MEAFTMTLELEGVPTTVTVVKVIVNGSTIELIFKRDSSDEIEVMRIPRNNGYDVPTIIGTNGAVI